MLDHLWRGAGDRFDLRDGGVFVDDNLFTHLPVDLHRHDGSRARRDPLLGIDGIQHVIVAALGQHRDATDHVHRGRARNVGVRWQDDLVTGADQSRVDMLALSFIGLRILYGILYLANKAPLRSLVWLAALVCTIMIFVAGK